MKRTALLGATTLLAALACGQEDSGVGPPIDLTGTPFDYWLVFAPSDSVFGVSGRVRGEGASWAMSSTGALVMELRSTPVEGASFGHARLDIVLTRFPIDSGNVPQLGQYEVGPIGVDFDGRAWLRDNTRTWASNSAGIVILNEWLPDGALQGQFALLVLRDETSSSGQVVEQSVSVVGTFTAKRVPSQSGSF